MARSPAAVDAVFDNPHAIESGSPLSPNRPPRPRASSLAHRRTLPHLQLAPHLHPAPHRQSFHGHAAPAVPHAPDDDDFAHDACAPMDDDCADVCLDDLPPKIPPRKPIYASRRDVESDDAARRQMAIMNDS